MREIDYGYQKALGDISLAEARAKVSAALAAEEFGVLTEIDVKATLKKKLDLEFRPYIILGACNPGLAHKALVAEPQIGLLLPCNVVLQQEDTGVLLSIANPLAMFAIVDNPALESVAAEADQRLRRVVDAL